MIMGSDARLHYMELSKTPLCEKLQKVTWHIREVQYVYLNTNEDLVHLTLLFVCP